MRSDQTTQPNDYFVGIYFPIIDLFHVLINISYTLLKKLLKTIWHGAASPQLHSLVPWFPPTQASLEQPSYTDARRQAEAVGSCGPV